MTIGHAANAILCALAAEDLTLLRGSAEDVALERGSLVVEAGTAPPYLYFPTSGVLSLLGTTSGGSTVEVAVVGTEGVANVSAFLGSRVLPFRIVTQVPGRALRVPADLVIQMAGGRGQLEQRILAYTHHLIAQIAQSAICNRFHSAKQRLARWLLMIADRASSNELPLTHEFISYMVGGPRSAVTEAAVELREAGAIDYRRALILIHNAELLRVLACECYNVLQVDTRARASGAA